MHYYGMKYRGFSPYCQPMEGLIERLDDFTGKYWDILVYDRMLTRRECEDYDLEYIASERGER